MTVMQQAEHILGEMTPAEKIQFLQLIAHDLSGAIPGIFSTPDVCGGESRIAGTRIPYGFWCNIANLARQKPTYYACIHPSVLRISPMPGLITERIK